MSIDSQVRRYIKDNGHITIDRLMIEVLSAHKESYYQRQNFLGIGGDFITAPELSQLYGEMIGLWCIDQWYKLGCPKSITLIELGPGRGLLMRDVIRTSKLIPAFYNSIRIQLIEINQNFIQIQKDNLKHFGKEIIWSKKPDNITQSLAIIIASEFFDAMPTKQYIKNHNTWFEVVAVLNSRDNCFEFSKISIDDNLQKELLKNYPLAISGAIVEESPISLDIFKLVCNHISAFKSMALIIDYGYFINTKSRNSQQYLSTLQAIKNHKFHSLFDELGAADLSVHVDFHKFYQHAQKFNIMCKVRSQHDFLVEYGILKRAELLKKNLDKIKAKIIDNQVNYLISPQHMGDLFKVLELTHHELT